FALVPCPLCQRHGHFPVQISRMRAFRKPYLHPSFFGFPMHTKLFDDLFVCHKASSLFSSPLLSPLVRFLLQGLCNPVDKGLKESRKEEGKNTPLSSLFLYGLVLFLQFP